MCGLAILEIEVEDYIWAIVVFVGVTIIRFTMLVCFFPILNRIGKRVSWKDIIVMTWGGLRGMVGLALAIIVQHELAANPDTGVQQISKLNGDRILFLVG